MNAFVLEEHKQHNENNQNELRRQEPSVQKWNENNAIKNMNVGWPIRLAGILSGWIAQIFAS